MAAGYFWNIALNEAQNITSLPAFCKRVRYRKSTCQRCLETCPENAISLNPGPVINSSCSECGLCLNVCPTEVFHNGFLTDRHLINQAQSFHGKDQRPGERKTLFIHCHQAEKQNENSLLLPCLGRITENIILGVALSGFDTAVLTKGICSQCRFRSGETLLTHSVRISRMVLESIGLGNFSISVIEKEKRKDPVLSRREIFTSITHTVKNKAESFVYHRQKAIGEKLIGKPETKEGIRPSPRREFLRKLLKEKDGKNDTFITLIPYQQELPWGTIRIDEKNCCGCGTCLALCPTGAITKEIENGYQYLYFRGSLCTSCSLCQEACPENVIDFEKDFTLAAILEEATKVVAKVALASCIVCGEIITAGKNTICPTCQKRQVWPIHANV